MLRSAAKAFLRRKRVALSVVVVAYNMPRELPRTLHSLSAGYQRHVDADDYEVIVVDNGSTPPVDRGTLERLPGNFRLIRIDPAPPSPARAVNRGLAEAKGEAIGVMIDGARLATPGLMHFAVHGARLHRRAVVATLNWYLGYDYQRWAMRCGYDQAQEDALLASIDWPNDGYRLFEIGTVDESCVEGWYHPIAESNALFMRRAAWEELGGMEANGQTVLFLDSESGSTTQPVTDTDSHFLAWTPDGSAAYLKVDSLSNTHIVRAYTDGKQKNIPITEFTRSEE